MAGVILAAALAMLAAGGAQAQGGAAASAAADRAEAAAAEVEAILRQLRGEVAEAAEAAGEAEGAAKATEPARAAGAARAAEPVRGVGAGQPAAAGREPASATRAEQAAPRSEVEAAVEKAEAAARRAEDAAIDARRAAIRIEEQLEAYRDRYARLGPYVGVAGLYAFETFDTRRFDVDDSRGFAVFAGWRVHRHVAIEARGEVLRGFDATPQDPASTLVDAQYDGFLVTAGPKAYALTGVFQPYVGLGFGGFHAELEGTFDDGSHGSDRATEAVIRPAVGFDLYLSENLVVNVDAAYVSPGGQLDDLEFGIVSTGLALRF